MNKLLVYRWGSTSEKYFMEALDELHLKYAVLQYTMENYHADAAFAGRLIDSIHKENIDGVFSYDYFPLISMICEINKIPYISWIYDCPQYTLMSKTLSNECNYIYCFDRIFTSRLQKMGAVHCTHYPLSHMPLLKKDMESINGKAFACDISFVGNLYNESKNRLRTAGLNQYTAGYIEGLLQSQLQVYGYNFISEVLPQDIVDNVVKACGLKLGDEYMQDDRQLAADTIGMEVSARERERVLDMLGDTYSIDIYTGSSLPDTLKKENIHNRGYADYEKDVPYIYNQSRINLNITSKTIESGIPQRVFDILSCGGFCLTNYQPEIAEYFEDGTDLVMYTGMDDLRMKADYYLEHEQERRDIALNGRNKVIKQFSLKDRIKDMLI